MSTTPTAASISSRLTTTSSLLLERSRIISLNLKPSPSSTSQIIRNLTSIKRDLDALETKDDDLHGGGSGKGKGVAGGGDGSSLGELGESYDRLLEMLSEDDVGREKVKTLQREKRQPTPSPAATAEVPPKSKSPLPRIHTPSSAEVPKLSVEPPTPGAGVTRFRDFPDSDDEANEIGLIGAPSPHEMLSGQQAMMDDQDERLNLLSHSIGRQNHLSIQIGSELDLHHQLLEDTDAAMDRTAASLGRARRRLDRVAEDAKQHGSTITIVLLIFILLVLIIVFKT
ncbi:syntaxin 8 [Kwoniella heveanensis CBS 569]|nr:syntaxin 8 [Kwoniella heveanensis CBS 569]